MRKWTFKLRACSKSISGRSKPTAKQSTSACKMTAETKVGNKPPAIAARTSHPKSQVWWKLRLWLQKGQISQTSQTNLFWKNSDTRKNLQVKCLSKKAQNSWGHPEVAKFFALTIYSRNRQSLWSGREAKRCLSSRRSSSIRQITSWIYQTRHKKIIKKIKIRLFLAKIRSLILGWLTKRVRQVWLTKTLVLQDFNLCWKTLKISSSIPKGTILRVWAKPKLSAVMEIYRLHHPAEDNKKVSKIRAALLEETKIFRGLMS